MKHLREVDMRYFQHLRHAWRSGATMIVAGLACILHGVFPCLFTSVASRAIVKLFNKHIRRNNRDA